MTTNTTFDSVTIVDGVVRVGGAERGGRRAAGRCQRGARRVRAPGLPQRHPHGGRRGHHEEPTQNLRGHLWGYVTI